MHEQAISSISQTEHKLCSLTKRAMIISPVPERIQDILLQLTTACFDVFALHELNEALLTSLRPELVLYDGLPIIGVDGEVDRSERDRQLLKNIVEIQIPLVVLLDEASYARQNEFLLSGAEFIAWPSNKEDVINQIHTLLDNSSVTPAYSDWLLYKDLKIDMKRMIVMRDEEKIELTKTEYDLLLYFLNSDGSVQTREVLLDVIWGLQFYAGSNVVDVHIKSLRKKLEDSAVDPKYIVTVRGVGYRLADQ